MNNKQVQQAMLYINWFLIQTIDYNIEGWELIWITTEHTQPTQTELDTASIQVEKEISLKDKMNRLYEIDTALRKMNAPWVIIRTPSLIAINEAKILELNTEADTIQDDITANYESTLVDDLYTSLFM